MREYRARAGTVIVLDIATGEVLAMVNQPSFNPNDRMQFDVARLRNRAVTDIFEPGSSIKPFVMAAALASGKYNANSTVDAMPFQVASHVIRDHHDLGTIGLGQVLALSSNVGMAKIALSLDRSQMHDTLGELGFGKVTDSGFPGESAGLLSSAQNWRPINIATMSYGYGLSVTPLQLAQAYATVGAFGIHRPITFRRLDAPPAGERVLPAPMCARACLAARGRRDDSGRHRRRRPPCPATASPAKPAPRGSRSPADTRRTATSPCSAASCRRRRRASAVLVMVDDPRGALYYGGDVAAPVFSKVSSGALRADVGRARRSRPRHARQLSRTFPIERAHAAR